MLWPARILRKLTLLFPAPRPAAREAAVIGTLWMVVVGLLCSRALLSIAMILFGAAALYRVPPRRWTTPVLWLGLGWVGLYALSGFWSADQMLWREHLQVKLPVLLIPAAFAALAPFSARARTVLLLGIATIGLCGIGYSLAAMVRSPEEVIAGYGISHALRTPMYGNHISFSALIASTLVLLVAGWKAYDSRLARRLVVFCAVVFVAYLHLLAAKTGLVMLYGAALFGIGRMAFGRQRRLAILLLLCAVVAVLLAARWVPTFSKKIDYVRYSIAEARRGARSDNYSDVSRVLSYRVALDIVPKHLLIGVGAGDMEAAMAAGYATRYPDVPLQNQLLPHNQALCMALAAGLPALLFFLLWLGYPLRRALDRRVAPRDRAWLAGLWAVLLVPLLVEPFLEVQSGVAVHLLSGFLQWHACAAEPKRRRATDVPE